jgi:hypothetical protein
MSLLRENYRQLLTKGRAMRKAHLLGAVLVVVLATASSVMADTGGRPLSTTLSGAEEVSSTGQVGVGDPDGTGFASLTLNQGQDEICFDIAVTNLDEPITRAHIHQAAAGSNGAIVVNFVEPGVTPFTFSDGIARGCVAAAPELIKGIRQNPDAFYCNVHNGPFPAGAVRGQLGD